MGDRPEKGAAVQAEIFGGQKEAWKGSPINRWLAVNCFGGFYTCTGIDLKQRDDYVLFSYGPRRLRTAAHCPCKKKYESGERQGVSNLGNISMSALYGLSPPF